MDFAWLQPSQRRPFQLTDRIEKASRKPGTLLIAAWNGKARIQRCASSSPDAVRKDALDLCERTGDPVVVADCDSAGVLTALGRVMVAKADPLSFEAFDGWSDELARRLTGLAVTEADDIIERARDIWILETATTANQAAMLEAEGAIARLIGQPSREMIGAQRLAITNQSSQVVSSVGSSFARTPAMERTLAAGLRLPGNQIGQNLSQFHGFFVRDQYGRVSQSLGRQASEIIQGGLGQGLGRKEIAAQLEATMRGGLTMRGYWETVASNAVGNARSYSLGSTMRIAGIKAYRYVAIMDQRTTEVCWFANDKIMPVDPAMARMDQMMNARTPEQFVNAKPWAQQSGDNVYITQPDGSRTTLFTVSEPSDHTTGTQGSYTDVLPPGELAEAGLGFAPLHARCRTTMVAVV